LANENQLMVAMQHSLQFLLTDLPRRNLVT